jgi:monovalent cation:H+ antiporter, CPA1 family
MTTNFAIQFLIWLLIAASIIAVVAQRLRIPYTVALVLGGLVLGSVRVPLAANLILEHRPDWLTADVILLLFLPPLLFEGSLNIQVRHLRENLVPILLLATIGVFAATLVTGFVVHWALGFPLWIALMFGAIISATDPISVLAVFRDLGVVKRLAVIVESESLFNDGTAAVLFTVLLGGIATGTLSWGTAIANFLLIVLGGAAVGLLLGYLASKITERIDEPRIEITLTTILAYSSYLVADALHVSGVIATVAAGLTVGNFGVPVGMSPRTRLALWSFWEYFSFLINSIVFLLIGMEVRLGDLFHAWHATLLGVGAVLLGRVLSVYTLMPVSNFFGETIPLAWQPVLVWGGLRGALALALALSLQRTFPYRHQILTMTFAVVAFTIVVQGLTIKSLLRKLGITITTDDDYDRARVRQISISAVREELETLFKIHTVSLPVYENLTCALEHRLEKSRAEVVRMHSGTRFTEELENVRTRLVAAEKSSIRQAANDGLISQQTAAEMIDAVGSWVDEIARANQTDAAGN